MQKGTVRNPLALIAIFASISEVAMTVVLLRLTGDSQYIFIWFVMAFPTLLVGMFFFVLYNKPTVLFSPADYQEDATYLRSLKSGKDSEQLNTRIEQIEEVIATLIEYINKLADSAFPNESSIIEAEKKKLKAISSAHEWEKNKLYRLMNKELGIPQEDIVKIISKATSPLDILAAMTSEINDKPKVERIQRILSLFPKSLSDFAELKKLAVKGEQL
jgi:hypothetical protein